MSSMSKPEERNFMTFTINVDNNITVLDSPQKIEERREGTETFSSSPELAAPAAQRWRTAAACGAEEGKCEEQGPPPHTTGRARQHQAGESNRAAATARRG